MGVTQDPQERGERIKLTGEGKNNEFLSGPAEGGPEGGPGGGREVAGGGSRLPKTTRTRI